MKICLVIGSGPKDLGNALCKRFREGGYEAAFVSNKGVAPAASQSFSCDLANIAHEIDNIEMCLHGRIEALFYNGVDPWGSDANEQKSLLDVQGLLNVVHCVAPRMANAKIKGIIGVSLMATSGDAPQVDTSGIPAPLDKLRREQLSGPVPCHTLEVCKSLAKGFIGSSNGVRLFYSIAGGGGNSKIDADHAADIYYGNTQAPAALFALQLDIRGCSGGTHGGHGSGARGVGAASSNKVAPASVSANSDESDWSD